VEDLATVVDAAVVEVRIHSWRIFALYLLLDLESMSGSRLQFDRNTPSQKASGLGNRQAQPLHHSCFSEEYNQSLFASKLSTTPDSLRSNFESNPSSTWNTQTRTLKLSLNEDDTACASFSRTNSD